ncbi:MAG: tetratricopeptide repeat protein [Alphaproteobacteria bacterium]|nr:tetratricopeptide repeat protein [Alphaproteobacteria bacterium]
MTDLHALPPRLHPLARPLLGRASERAACAQAWRDGARILLLVGPPGAGTSALALRAALDLAPIEALCWADLSSDGWAAELRLPTDAQVVVLDGADDPDAALRGALPLTPPACRIILTSRRVTTPPPGLCTLPVHPLSLSPQGDGLSPAAALLVAEAQRRCPTAPPLPPTAAEALARGVDGLPLALVELGARLSVMGPGPLLERLRAGRLDALSAARIAQALDRSRRTLSPHARSSLDALSVFEGPFVADAAMAVIGEVTEAVGLGALEELLEGSLLARRGDADGASLLALLRPLRCVLETPPEARERHARWFADQARRWVSEARGARAADARAWAGRARADLCAALDTALSRSHDATLQAAAAELVEALQVMVPGWLPGSDLLARASRALADAPPALRARVDLALGDRLLVAGRLDQAEALYDSALQAAPDAGLVGRARTGRAAALAMRGHTAEALAEYSRAIEALSTPVTLIWRGRALAWKGLALLDAGDVEAGAALVRRGLTDLERADDQVGVAVHEANLGLAFFRQGAFEPARRLLERALRRAEATGDLRFQAAILSNLGGVDQCLGRYEAATDAYRRVSAAMDHVIDARLRYAVQLGHATALHAQGRPEAARAHYEQARRVAWALADPHRESECEGFLAALAVATGLPAEGASRLERARALAPSPPARLEVTLALLDALVRLAGWRDLLQAGELTAAAGSIREARGQLRASARQVGPAVMSAWRAARLLEHACAQAEAALEAAGAGPLEIPDATDALIVEPGAVGIWLPAGAYVDLRRSRLKRRLLLALVEAHLARPGTTLDLDALWQAGWGDEVALGAARRNRVYVAVSSLRTAGLEALLQTTPEGYRLAPELAVVLRRAP